MLINFPVIDYTYKILLRMLECVGGGVDAAVVSAHLVPSAKGTLVLTSAHINAENDLSYAHTIGGY
jgi:hypothetical protein